MAIDPRSCSRMLVTDTCSIWNMLSARKLFSSAILARLHFSITPMVEFECLYNAGNAGSGEQEELQSRFRAARSRGELTIQPCDLESLIEVARRAPVGLGSGELSCIATVFRISTMAVLTDDKQARYHAEQRLSLPVETTPKIYAWLHYSRHLSDGDHGDIICEHERYERRPLTKFLNLAYESALQFRLMEQN